MGEGRVKIATTVMLVKSLMTVLSIYQTYFGDDSKMTGVESGRAIFRSLSHCGLQTDTFQACWALCNYKSTVTE